MVLAKEKELVTFILDRLDKTHESIGVIYHQMFTMSIDPVEDLRSTFGYAYDNYMKETKKNEGEWFYIFHKSIRQVDFYGNHNTAFSRNAWDSKRSESIAGKLDSILWNLIHVDEHQFLYKFLAESFEAYKSKKKTERKFGLHQR